MSQIITSNRAIYVSTPLGPQKAQIRIVHLQPRLGSDEIRCSLEVIDFEDELRHEYAALSYEWGDLDISQCIILNGSRFAVRKNLWWALWHLRKEKKQMTIWINALCIDQEDIRERNHQVSTFLSGYSKHRCETKDVLSLNTRCVDDVFDDQ